MNLLSAVARETAGKLHVLVNNAGTNWAEPVESYPIKVQGEGGNRVTGGEGGSCRSCRSMSCSSRSLPLCRLSRRSSPSTSSLPSVSRASPYPYLKQRPPLEILRA